METKNAAYEVHPSQLRWALSSLAGAGVPIVGYQQLPGTGMYVIVVQVPVQQEEATDWRTMQPKRKRRISVDWRRLVMWACVIAIVAGVGYGAYSLIASGALTGIFGGHASGDPTPVTTPAPAQGWFPNPFGDAVDGVKSAADSVTAAVGMLVQAVMVLAALIGLWFMRGIIGPIVQGLGGLGKGLFGMLGKGK